MGRSEDIRVVLADDHDLFRRGLRDLLEERGIRVVGEASDGDDAVRLARHAMPDVVVMDLSMPRVSGIEATRRLAESAPAVRVLALTASVDDASVMEAVEAGVVGYLLKDAGAEEIAAGVRAAAGGESLVSPRVATKLLARLRRARDNGAVGEADLSERELEVLRLLGEGCDNEQIAEALVISPSTVKHHVGSILAKLQLENRLQAAVYAARRGIA